jgi:hypothetical protein
MNTESAEKKARAIRARRDRTQASERTSAQKGSAAKLARTIILGTIAVAGAIVWIGDQYGVDPEQTIQFLALSAIFVGILVFAGLLGSLILSLIRLLIRRMDGGGE